MKFVGSKNKYTKEILPIILDKRLKENYYVEPFVGGFNTIDKVSGLRIANDINPYLTALFRAIQKNWIPPDTITEEEYKDIQKNKENFPEELVGFVGFGCSYSGKFFGGYARGSQNNGCPRNYCLEGKKKYFKTSTSYKRYRNSYWKLL